MLQQFWRMLRRSKSADRQVALGNHENHVGWQACRYADKLQHRRSVSDLLYVIKSSGVLYNVFFAMSHSFASRRMKGKANGLNTAAVFSINPCDQCYVSDPGARYRDMSQKNFH